MSPTIPDAFADVLSVPEVQTRTFMGDGPFPNNPALPVLVLRRAVRTENGGVARALERVFGAHEWRGHWRNGVFPYHHYHSTAQPDPGRTRRDAEHLVGGAVVMMVRKDAVPPVAPPLVRPKHAL